MRVPLAVKVIIAFMAVIAAGVVPIHYTLHGRVAEAAREHRLLDLQDRARRLAHHLDGSPTDAMLHELGAVSDLGPERVTLVALDGAVLFDSAALDLKHVENHLQRPEIQSAIQTGEGTASRNSTTTGVPQQYAAALVRGKSGPAAVLRISAPTESDGGIADAVTTVTSRGTALSVSLALLLSLVAVIRIVGPLRRMRDGAARLAGGELTLSLDVRTNDELEELARALEVVGAHLRARLAAAGNGEALVGQMVHAMVQGVLIIAPDGRVVHINGVARAKLGLRGPKESERLTNLLESRVVHAAMKAATLDPLGVDIRVPHPVTGALIDGVVVALRRSHGGPMHALMLDVQHGDAATMLEIPDLNDVVAVPFRELMDRALSRVHEDLEDHNATFSAPDEWPASNVVDAGGRVEGVVTETLRAAVKAAGSQVNTPLVAAVHDHAVCLRLPVNIPPELVQTLQPRLSPLGGKVAAEAGSIELWLPMA